MVEPRTLLSHPEIRSHQSFPLFRAVGEKPKSALERALSVFADVRGGEGLTAILMACNVFLLLGGYYLLKTAREALILTEGGAEVKVYSAAGQALLLLGVVPLYGWLGSKVNRIRLLTITTLFFAANLILFNLAGASGARIGVVFYIWLGIFNVFVISQFWAFANDIYTEGQGRRLFPLIGVGSSLGAWIGSVAAVPLVETLQLSPYALMLIAACILGLSLTITITVNRRSATHDPESAKQSEQPLSKAGGFQLIFQDRYLFWIAMLVVLLNVVNTSGEFLLSKLVVQQAADHFGHAAHLMSERQRYIGAFYGGFYGWVNLVGLLLQLFATSRILRYAGVRGALFILPILGLVTYSIVAVAPILLIVRLAKILENSVDYSLQNTVMQALYLPTTRESKYKAKAAIDTFFMRTGDVVQAGIVKGGTMIGAGITAFAWLNVILSVAWIGVAVQIARQHRKRTV